jgi:hypothetical protein
MLPGVQDVDIHVPLRPVRAATGAEQAHLADGLSIGDAWHTAAGATPAVLLDFV